MSAQPQAAAYTPGQENGDARIGKAWIAASRSAIEAVQRAEKPKAQAPAATGRCTRCGAPTLAEFKAQPAMTGGDHPLPEWRSEWTVHADDRTLANRAYCERPVPRLLGEKLDAELH